MARTATGQIEGDRLVVDNVRNFAWQGPTDFLQRWEGHSYNLASLTDVDLLMSYWAGETIAHTIVSFGFDDGSYLAFSIETRKEKTEAYSAIAGFFKRYEIIMIAADDAGQRPGCCLRSTLPKPMISPSTRISTTR